LAMTKNSKITPVGCSGGTIGGQKRRISAGTLTRRREVLEERQKNKPEGGSGQKKVTAQDTGSVLVRLVAIFRVGMGYGESCSPGKKERGDHVRRKQRRKKIKTGVLFAEEDRGGGEIWGKTEETTRGKNRCSNDHGS